jgi:hypothetical protein
MFSIFVHANYDCTLNLTFELRSACVLSTDTVGRTAGPFNEMSAVSADSLLLPDMQSVKITIPKGTTGDTRIVVAYLNANGLTKGAACYALDMYGSDGDMHRTDLDRRRIVGLRRKGREGAKTGFGYLVQAWKVEWPRPKSRGANDADSVYLSLASPTADMDSSWLDGGGRCNMLFDADLAQFSDHIKSEPGHVRLCWECTVSGCTNVVRLPDMKGCFKHTGKLLFAL